MRWLFWKSSKNVDSPGVKEAQARLNEAYKQRNEMDDIVARHREVRRRNHLGPAAAASLQGRRGSV